MKKLFLILIILAIATPLYADNLSEAQTRLWGLLQQQERIQMEYKLNAAEIKKAKALVAKLSKKAAKKKGGAKKDVEGSDDWED